MWTVGIEGRNGGRGSRTTNRAGVLELIEKDEGQGKPQKKTSEQLVWRRKGRENRKKEVEKKSRKK